MQNSNIYLSLASLVSVQLANPISMEAQEVKPNIVVILADDLGFSDIGCYGSEIPTPNIDKLAEQGIRFSRFYNAARCCPSRASLLTGLYPHQTGIGAMAENPLKNSNDKDGTDRGLPGYRAFLNDKCLTIAEVLKSGGYHTYMTGKWHVGMHGKEKWPLQRGFDRYYGILSGATSYFKPEGIRCLTLDNSELPAPMGEYYTTDAFTDYAIGFVKEQKDNKPFFLYLAYNAPHWPLHAKKQDYDKFVGKYMEGWDVLREERYKRQLAMKLFNTSVSLSPRDQNVRAWSETDSIQKIESDFRMAVYAAQVASMDENIGKLINVLDSLKKLDNTLILFLSDNGGCAEPYAEFGGGKSSDINNPEVTGAVSYGIGWANLSNTPFYEYKVKSYEGGISTPFIAYWPKMKIKNQGKIIHTPAHLIDIMPTIIDAAGLNYPKKNSQGTELFQLEGFSLLPEILKGKTKNHKYIFWEHADFYAISKGDWKACKSIKSEKWELYNLHTDRHEQNNLASKHPEMVALLSKRWYKWANKHQVFPK